MNRKTLHSVFAVIEVGDRAYAALNRGLDFLLIGANAGYLDKWSKIGSASPDLDVSMTHRSLDEAVLVLNKTAARC